MGQGTSNFIRSTKCIVCFNLVSRETSEPRLIIVAGRIFGDVLEGVRVAKMAGRHFFDLARLQNGAPSIASPTNTKQKQQTETAAFTVILLAMAPTLKEVDAIELKAAASAPALAAAVESERVGIAVETVSSGMPPVNQDHATAPPAAAPSPPVRQSTTTTITTTAPPTKPLITSIERENPNDIPPDESAFLVPPHFSRNNPFHRNLANLDLAMRCAICSELYHAPVTLIPCMHAFCSLCVRAHFKSTLTG